jgi:hypothetical protein
LSLYAQFFVRIIVVEEIERITPKRCCPFVSSPSIVPLKPINTIVIIWVIVIDAVPPTFISFLKLNSSPRLNSNMITPISAQTSTLFTSLRTERNQNGFQLENQLSNTLKLRVVLVFKD